MPLTKPFRDRGFAVGAPVDNPFAAVDQALFIEIDEHLLDRLVAALIHREPLMPVINVLNEDATINENGGKYAGMTREECRKAIVSDLEAGGVEIFQLFGFVRPSKGRKWPERRAEPGVKGVGVLMDVPAV